MKAGMIKVSVLYPNGKGSNFNIDYYSKRHVPMVLDLLSPAVKGGAIEKGLIGINPEVPATYLAMGHLYFETIDEFQRSFTPHAGKIMSDIPAFTNTNPVIQISEVVM